jgi:acyl-CoA synthetase (AMP-forming)/AMP-acid ligase II
MVAFGDLWSISNTLAHELVNSKLVEAVGNEEIEEGKVPVVAIISQSSCEMLATFLALVRVGYAPLLVSYVLTCLIIDLTFISPLPLPLFALLSRILKKK